MAPAGSLVVSERQRDAMIDVNQIRAPDIALNGLPRADDRFYPSFQKTTSRNISVTGHDGVFAVEQNNVESYFARFAPHTPRYNRTHTGIPGMPINFGNAKGDDVRPDAHLPARASEQIPEKRQFRRCGGRNTEALRRHYAGPPKRCVRNPRWLSGEANAAVSA